MKESSEHLKKNPDHIGSAKAYREKDAATQEIAE